MLKAKIDVTAYPLVRIKSPNKLITPRRAMCLIEFEPEFNFNPLLNNPNYLLYFKEDENEDEKIIKRCDISFAQCRTGCLQHSIIYWPFSFSGRIKGKPKTKGNAQEVDRRLASSEYED